MNDIGRSRSQIVYATLKDMIRDGLLQPGQRTREIEIAQAQGVSRTPVREAMSRLVSEGLLELSSGRGIAVAELSKQQVLEIYALREFLEGASARFAAQHASEPEIQSLRELLEHSRQISEHDPVQHAQLNRHFHSHIVLAAHNRYLERALALLSDSLMLARGTTFEKAGRVADVYEEHLAIIVAIEARNPGLAEQAARMHIQRAGEVRLQMLFGRD